MMMMIFLKHSLGSAEWPAHLQVVLDLARAAARVQRVVVGCAIRTLHLAVDVLQVVNRERLAVLLVQHRLTLLDGLLEALRESLVALGLALVVQVLQESVVLFVGRNLQRVLVVREQSVVTVRHVSKVTALKTKDWSK